MSLLAQSGQEQCLIPNVGFEGKADLSDGAGVE